MAIQFTCLTCRTVCSVGDELRGKLARCPNCKTTLVVPGAAMPPPQAPRPGSAEPAGRPGRLGAPPPRAEVTARPAVVRVDPIPNQPPRVVRPATPTLPGRFFVPLLAAVGAGAFGFVLLTCGVGVFFFWRAGPADSGAVSKQDLPGRTQVPPGPAPAKIEPATVRKVKDATVYLRVRRPNDEIAQGSGFFCLEPGVVVTNAHVLGMLRADARPPREVDVVVRSGEANELTLTGSVVAVDRPNDLAVLRVIGDASRLPAPLPVDSAEMLTETQSVYVFGFPLGAKLGKNITVSESSVTSLRRDGTGALAQVQVNGGMQPGNSGGPVTDSRGAVVGVAVAIIEGTQINFAVPGDCVVRLLDGKCDGIDLGSPYRGDGNAVLLPVKLNLLDPLGRVRDVKLEVWAGRAATSRPPAMGPGDGPRTSYPVTLTDGVGTAAVPLPARQPGQAVWLQPVFVNALGARQWDTATVVSEDAQVVLERKETLIQFKAPDGAIERTVQLNSAVTLSVYRGQTKSGVLSQKMEGNALESLGPDARGLGTFVRLTIGKCAFTREAAGQTFAPPAQAPALLAQYSPTFLVDASHTCKERGIRNFRILSPDVRDTVERMYETVCNTFEATTLPVPGRVVRPGEQWQAQVPMFVIREGRRQIMELHLTCTYDGVRSVGGRNDAAVTLAGEARSRGGRPEVLGTVKGNALIDVDRGFLTLVRLSVDSEVEDEDEGVRVLVSHESVVRRTEGNTQGITPARTNQPGGR